MFDLKVHTIDSFGKVLSANPYRLHVSADKGAMFERNGILYYANGEIVQKTAIPAKVEKEEIVDVKPKTVRV